MCHRHPAALQKSSTRWRYTPRRAGHRASRERDPRANPKRGSADGHRSLRGECRSAACRIARAHSGRQRRGTTRERAERWDESSILLRLFDVVSTLYSLAHDLSMTPQTPRRLKQILTGRPRRGKPKIALVLGGGGLKGFAHIGVIRAMMELGIDPTVIAGTSIGSLIAAAYGGGMPVKEMEDRARALKRRDLFRLNR